MDDAEIRRLAREVFAPLAAAGERGRVNRALVRALGDTGLLGRLFPTPLGGTGGDGVSATELCRLREGLARECTEAETALALQGLGTYPVVQSGSAELAARHVPAVARGEAVAAFALSEPGAGSDAAALTLAAESDGAGWRLSGEKIWISNAPDADLYTVFARTGPPGSRAVGRADRHAGPPRRRPAGLRRRGRRARRRPRRRGGGVPGGHADPRPL